MTSLIKNQVLKHLTKFFKDLAPEQLQLSAFKGSCELSNLQLEEKVLMELLSFPAWLGINRATCDQLSIKIPWTKIKSVPIQMNLNEVTVEVEVCDEFRDVDSVSDELNLANIINSAQTPGKYGFVDRVIDGITVTVNSVLITFKSKLMSATFNLSRVILESRCPNWKQGELSLTRIKDTTRGQILLFKVVEWQNMRLEAKCLTDPLQAPLRLITNHAQCRLTIKKQLEDCSVSAARIFVIFEDILWVLTFAQFVSAAAFVEYIFTLIKRSPMSKKNNLCDQQAKNPSAPVNLSNSSISNQSSFTAHQAAPSIAVTNLKSPLNTPMHVASQSGSDKSTILTGNMSYASLSEHKFLCYDLLETSLHLFIDKVDAHLYDDIEMSANSSRDSGGALQTTFDQIQVDCYPYSRVTSDRKHWYKWFDPSPNSRKQWLNSHFAEFDLQQAQRANNLQSDQGSAFNQDFESLAKKKQVVTALDDLLLSLTVLVRIKDYCMNCVATRHSNRNVGLNKFIQTDKDYHMPSEMPSFYLELDYFYYFDSVNRMMIYENVPDPLAFMHLSPTKLLFDSPTLVFLNSFHVNLSKAFVHLNDLFPQETTAPNVHCRIEILMPQVSLPAKSSKSDRLQDCTTAATSALLIKTGKVTLCNSIYDKNILSKLMDSIDKLKKSPSQPINLGSGYQPNNNNSSSRKEFSSKGDWSEIWNTSLVDNMDTSSLHNQLWCLQFEPVWMDFMNHDVDDLATSQRLEPIVEPVNASAFIHLNLASKKTSNNLSKSDKCEKTSSLDGERNTISILVSVLDGPILANMDKVQFSFLQRLGMQVEKLLQQIREDASALIQMDATFEDTLELNLTAYIREIKARLILDKKKIDTRAETISTSGLEQTHDHVGRDSSMFSVNKNDNLINSIPNLSYQNDISKAEDIEIAVGIDNCSVDRESLDECVEVAEDATSLLLGDPFQPEVIENSSDLHQSTASRKADSKHPHHEGSLIDLDGMDQSASLFAKVGLNPMPSSKVSNQGDATDEETQSVLTQTAQQDIVNETVSYLELSMSKLMVRRITETRRRQRF